MKMESLAMRLQTQKRRENIAQTTSGDVMVPDFILSGWGANGGAKTCIQN
jgi:hypothetical protein